MDRTAASPAVSTDETLADVRQLPIDERIQRRPLMQQRDSTAAKLEAEKAVVEQQLRRLTNQSVEANAVWVQSFAHLNEALAAAKADLLRQTEVSKHLQAELTTVKQQVVTASEALDKSKERNAALQDNVTELTSQLHSLEVNKEAECSVLKNDLKTATAMLKEAKEQSAALQGNLAILTQAFDAMRNENSGRFVPLSGTNSGLQVTSPGNYTGYRLNVQLTSGIVKWSIVFKSRPSNSWSALGVGGDCSNSYSESMSIGTYQHQVSGVGYIYNPGNESPAPVWSRTFTALVSSGHQLDFVVDCSARTLTITNKSNGDVATCANLPSYVKFPVFFLGVGDTISLV